MVQRRKPTAEKRPGKGLVQVTRTTPATSPPRWLKHESRSTLRKRLAILEQAYAATEEAQGAPEYVVCLPSNGREALPNGSERGKGLPMVSRSGRTAIVIYDAAKGCPDLHDPGFWKQAGKAQMVSGGGR